MKFIFSGLIETYTLTYLPSSTDNLCRTAKEIGLKGWIILKLKLKTTV